MKSFLIAILTVTLIGTIAYAQDRGGWEFFNFREVQEEVRNPTPSREADTIRLPDSGDVRDTRQTILPTFQSSEPFDVLVTECVAIEGQFGRECNSAEVTDMLLTSAVFEGDAARTADNLPEDGDVVAAANVVFKDASQEELKGYTWGLLYEKAAYYDGEMHELMQGTKMLKMANFTKGLKDSMAMWAAQKKFMETGKATAAPGESADDADAIAKKYMSGGGGAINYAAVTKDLFPGASCFKTIKWQLPKAGGGFGPKNSAGDTNPDSGGGTPTGPDGKPISPAEKLANTKADCSMIDPQKLAKGDSIGYDPEKAKAAGSNVWRETTGFNEFSGTGQGEQGSGLGGGEYEAYGFTKEKATFGNDGGGKPMYLGSQYEHDIVLTGKNGQGTSNVRVTTKTPNPPPSVTTPKGDTVKLKTKPIPGTEKGTLQPKEKDKTPEQKKAEMEKPKDPKKKKGTYDDPNAEVAATGQACGNMAENAFQNCLFGALTKDFEKSKEQQYCDEKGWVAGEGKIGGSSIYCGPKGSAKALDQQQIFMKTGGGVTDPMMKQGGSNAAQPPQDGQFKQAQPSGQ